MTRAGTSSQLLRRSTTARYFSCSVLGRACSARAGATTAASRGRSRCRLRSSIPRPRLVRGAGGTSHAQVCLLNRANSDQVILANNPSAVNRNPLTLSYTTDGHHWTEFSVLANNASLPNGEACAALCIKTRRHTRRPYGDPGWRPRLHHIQQRCQPGHHARHRPAAAPVAALCGVPPIGDLTIEQRFPWRYE